MTEQENSILTEAQSLVYGKRNQDYGHPLDDFDRTAAMFTALLDDLLKPGVEITADRACLMMIAVKLSRQVNHKKRDNLTDIAGYAECTNRIINEEKRRIREDFADIV